MRTVVHRVAICSAAILIAACSNPSGPITIVQQINGTYGAAALEETDLGVPVAAPFRSGFSASGVVSVDRDLDGTPDEELDYGVDGEGTLVVDGVPVAEVSADGQLLIGGNLNPHAPNSGLTIGAAAKVVRGTGSFAFSGGYILCGLGGNSSTGQYFTQRRLGTADGIDRLLTGILAHSEGTTGSAALTFSVLDGDVAVDPYVGTMTFDGRTVVLSRPSNPDGEFVIAIRKTAGFVQPSFVGRFAGYSFRNDSGVSRTSRVTLEAAANGTGTLSEQRSDGSGSSRAIQFALHLDGTIDVDSGAESGIVSEDGRVVALVDTDRSDGDIGLLIALRRG